MSARSAQVRKSHGAGASPVKCKKQQGARRNHNDFSDELTYHRCDETWMAACTKRCISSSCFSQQRFI